MAVPQLSDVKNYLNQVTIRLNQEMNHKIKNYKDRLIEIQNRNIFKNPMVLYQAKEMMFDHLLEKLKFQICATKSETRLITSNSQRLT